MRTGGNETRQIIEHEHFATMAALHATRAGGRSNGGAGGRGRDQRDHASTIGTRTRDPIRRRFAHEKAVARTAHVFFAGRCGANRRHLLTMRASNDVLCGAAVEWNFNFANAARHRRA